MQCIFRQKYNVVANANQNSVWRVSSSGICRRVVGCVVPVVGWLLLARCFAELFYDPEDGGDTFLRNVGYHSTHYMASYPRRRYSSKPPLWKPQILQNSVWFCNYLYHTIVTIHRLLHLITLFSFCSVASCLLWESFSNNSQSFMNLWWHWNILNHPKHP
jgi:hypothetical protein